MTNAAASTSVCYPTFRTDGSKLAHAGFVALTIGQKENQTCVGFAVTLVAKDFGWLALGEKNKIGVYFCITAL
ncbi:hypothetical protein [Labrenzia sp. DG1229]|uniref:hypothetical protein n=1 Tax=Labrenzia sp. DG1229 TaxID=681847 RepID=UPI0012EB5A5C|nr:hypothetical protein [Labrenzia sp. DG1229]